jgi:integrase
MAKSRRKRTPKTVLKLPDLEQSKSAVLNSLTSASSKRSAIRRLAYEASDCGLLSPDLAAGIRSVKRVRRLGVRVGNWLTAEEGKRLLRTESRDNLRSCRNRALLALLIGCGLRRAEVTTLRFEDFQLRDGLWVIADLRGKGGHIRTIPVPEWVKTAVDRWALAANINVGPLLRSINKAGKTWETDLLPK